MSATVFGMLLVHLQHNLQRRELNIFDWTSFKIGFSIFLFLNVLATFAFTDYIVRQTTPTILALFCAEIIKFSNGLVTLIIIGSKSRSEDTARERLRDHNQFILKIYTIGAKLNSCIYLVHVTVAKVILGALIARNHFNSFTYLSLSLIFSYLAAIVMFLLIEQPIANFYQQLTARRQGKKEKLVLTKVN